MGVETYCVIPRLLGLGPSMARAAEWEQRDDGNNVGDVPESRDKRGLEGTCWNTTVSDEEDVDDRNKTGDGAKDNMNNFIIEVEKKFDEARGKKKDFRDAAGWECSQRPNANMELLDTREKESANSDAVNWRVRILSEPEDPLLHKQSIEVA